MRYAAISRALPIGYDNPQEMHVSGDMHSHRILSPDEEYSLFEDKDRLFLSMARTLVEGVGQDLVSDHISPLAHAYYGLKGTDQMLKVSNNYRILLKDTACIEDMLNSPQSCMTAGINVSKLLDDYEHMVHRLISDRHSKPILELMFYRLEEDAANRDTLSGLQDLMDRADELTGLVLYHNQRLVWDYIRKMKKISLDKSDLFCEGMSGLMKAEERFDHTTGNKFSTYAYWWIKQSINHSIHQTARTIRIPESTGDIMVKVDNEAYAYYERTGEHADLESMSLILGKNISTLRSHATTAYTAVSLDEPHGEDNCLNLADLIESKEPNIEDLAADAQMSRILDTAMSCLSPRDKDILKRRFFFEESLSHISQIYGISGERVRQIEKNALSKLKKDKNIRHLWADFF